MFNLKSVGRKTVAFIACASMLLSFSGCSSRMFAGTYNKEKVDVSNYTDVQKEFESFLDDYYKKRVTADTLNYNYSVKDGESMGLEEPEVSIGEFDFSEEKIAEDKKESEDYINTLKSFNRDDLTEEQQLTYDIFLEYMEDEMAQYENIYFYEPMSPMRGIQANLATNFTDYRFDDKADVERYIELIKQCKDYFHDVLEYEKVKSEKGYFMSDGVCDTVIDQCKDFISNKDNHFMITVFNDNIDALDFLTDEEKKEFKKQNDEAVKNYLIPAFEECIDVLSALKGTGKVDGGLSNYEGGKEYYTYLLKSFTGSEKTPEEIIEMLESEKTKLTTQLYTTMALDTDAYSYFADNYENMFSKTDDMTPSEIVDLIMDVSTEHYPDYDKIPYNAENLNKNLESIMGNVLAYYMSPAIDDQSNNIIRVNASHTDGMWVTLAHEGYPGHMLQNSYFMSTNPNKVRTLFNFLGYMEGWAMYSCYDTIQYYDFGDEYKDSAENIAKLYQINDELGYLLYGRLDLGINYEGWTLEECENYIVSSGYDSSIAEEIYYTLAGDPAVYQSYSTGYYEVKELHDYAEKKLGNLFDVKEFNTVLLKTGPCQFDILKREVDNYIEATK